MKLDGGMIVVVRFGHRGTQLARLLRPTRRGWLVEKWRKSSHRWTGEVHSGPILRVATQLDILKSDIGLTYLLQHRFSEYGDWNIIGRFETEAEAHAAFAAAHNRGQWRVWHRDLTPKQKRVN